MLRVRCQPWSSCLRSAIKFDYIYIAALITCLQYLVSANVSMAVPIQCCFQLLSVKLYSVSVRTGPDFDTDSSHLRVVDFWHR